MVGSVILGAVLGIIIVLRDKWGWLEIRVVCTTVVIAIASLCGLASDLSRTPRGANLLPASALVLTFISALLILIGMWVDLGEEEYWKATVVCSIFAVATVHVCLLSIVRLAGRFRWIFFLTSQVIYGLAVLLSIMILWEMGNNGRLFKFIAMASIVDAALTISIPLLHRISKTDATDSTMMTALDERNVDAIDQEISRLKKQIADLEKVRSELAGRR